MWKMRAAEKSSMNLDMVTGKEIIVKFHLVDLQSLLGTNQRCDGSGVTGIL